MNMGRDSLTLSEVARDCHTLLGEVRLSMHFFVRFEPQPGKEVEFREVLIRVMESSRAEPGCLGVHAFESLRPPCIFSVHSEWVDEAAFDFHATLPHTVRFVQAAEQLLTHPVQGLRTREFGGGAAGACG